MNDLKFARQSWRGSTVSLHEQLSPGAQHPRAVTLTLGEAAGTCQISGLTPTVEALFYLVAETCRQEPGFAADLLAEINYVEAKRVRDARRKSAAGQAAADAHYREKSPPAGAGPTAPSAANGRA